MAANLHSALIVIFWRQRSWQLHLYRPNGLQQYQMLGEAPSACLIQVIHVEQLKDRTIGKSRVDITPLLALIVPRHQQSLSKPNEILYIHEQFSDIKALQVTLVCMLTDNGIAPGRIPA